MARDSPLRPVVPAWIAAASIPGSRCGDGTSLVAIEGFLRFSVSHETPSLVPEHTAKHPLAIAGRFLVKTGSRHGNVNGLKPWGHSAHGRTPRRRHSLCAARRFHSPHPGPLPWAEGETG